MAQTENAFVVEMTTAAISTAEQKITAAELA
jgi:hypothetical protein